MKFPRFNGLTFSSASLIGGSFLAKVSNNSCSIDSSYSLFSNRENLAGNFWTSPSSKILINYLLILLLVFFTCFSENEAEACTSVTGPYSVNAPSTDCYSWNSGNMTVTNNGSIDSTVIPTKDSIATSGNVGILTNNGDIKLTNTSSGDSPIRINNNVQSIVNNNLIQGDGQGFSIFLQYGNVGSITNSGTISATNSVGNATALGMIFGTSILTNLNNLAGGIISSNVEAILVTGNSTSSYGTHVLTNLNNAGLITTSNYHAIDAWDGGTISNITNSGIISSTSTAPAANYNSINDSGSAIYNEGHMLSITNTGSIYTAGAGTFGIYNNVDTTISRVVGQIDVLNNLQGTRTISDHGPLTYTGTLPSKYNIIINSPSVFGQLSAGSVSGTMAFNIYGNTGTTLVDGVLASTVTSRTYADVLQGFVGSLSGSSITGTGFSITGTSGSYNGYSYSLVSDTINLSCTGCWDLVFLSTATDITTAGSPHYTANLGTSVNPVFDGGVLKVSAAGNVTQDFTITANNGAIDQNGVASYFSGNITNSAAGVNGKLTIANTGNAGQGSVTLSGINTYSGGTEVTAGANLSIASSTAIGSGTLSLVGSSTVPATLTTTATMTIANAVTVSGDPVFNVAPTTTTTITAPITDGVASGDVVVTGGGTLALTAANTYTGLTAVNAGSTLALSGAGSIATSSGLMNNGTFNITGKTSNVSVASYTQSATGNLAMNFSPSANQKLLVAGAASLAGGLSLNASSGIYSAGKYTLLTANGLSGKFGSFSSNLSSLTRLGYSLTYDANDVYLVFTPNTADTQQSIVNTAASLQNTFTLQNTVLANSFSYDCNEFGANGICISAGGRNTAVSAANGLNNTSALLIAAYKVHPQVRIGAYADQNLSVNNAGSTVNLGNNTPLIGLFGAWNQKLDGTGTEVKVSAAYGQKNTTVTRQVVGTSEAGSGSSQLNSQGAQVVAKYGFAVLPEVIVSPYAGIRYTQNNMGGYTEGTSATVTAPLTYSALNTNATTALAGLGASYRFIPKATVFASAGVESDTNTANGTYSGTSSSISGLTPINFNASPVKTRPTATVGAYYDVEKNHRVGITGIYRQEPYQAVQTTTVMANYMVGL